MSVKEWRQTRIRESLYSQVKCAVETIKVRGNIRKYDSVPDFINKACIVLLDQEKVEVLA